MQRQGPQLTHHINGGVGFLLQDAFGKFDDIVVVGAGQSLIAADDQKTLFAAEDRLPGAEKAVLQLRQIPQDLPDELLRLHEVGQRIIEGAPCLFDLGGGDEVHGIGDLHGILHAFYAALDISCTCHTVTCPCTLRPPSKQPAAAHR